MSLKRKQKLLWETYLRQECKSIDAGDSQIGDSLRYLYIE